MQAIIEVRKPYSDPRITTLESNGVINIREVVDAYRFYSTDCSLKDNLLEIAHALTNHVSEQFRCFIYEPDKNKIEILETNKTSYHEGNSILWDFRRCYTSNFWIIEKQPLQGVKNSLAEVILGIVSTLLQQKGINAIEQCIQVETSLLMIGTGRLPDLNLLYNPMIEELSLEKVHSKKVAFCYSHEMDSVTFSGDTKDLTLEELASFNCQNALNLSDIQLSKIVEYFRLQEGRSYVRDIELETIAQTWSEHCKHNIMSYPIDDLQEGIFRGYIKKSTETIIRNNPNHICASVFTDNAGAIWFDKDYLICVKVETHNSPSALEPFGGAMTGILGVNRDILGFGLAAKPIANYYAFCVEDPDTENQDLYHDSHKTKPKLDSRTILKGIIRGVNAGGNCSGIPTPQGALYFSSAFRAKPLVFVGCAGIIPAKIAEKESWVKAPRDGDLIVIAGGRTGRDGIHGATFSSTGITDSNVKGTEVQLGDPFTQKKLSDAIIREVRDADLCNAITDNGAGGLSSSVGEMGKNGFVVHLEKVLLKTIGLAPWEIWISESQERMTFAIPREKLEAFGRIMTKHGVEFAVIGEFNRSGRGLITFEGKTVFDLSLCFLHDGNPTIHLQTKKPREMRGQPHVSFSSLEEAIRDKNVCSRKFIAEQYDHEVQGTSILKPLQGKNEIFSDVTAIKPLYNSRKCIGQSQDLAIITRDPYLDTCSSIEKAVRNLVTIGVNPQKIALLDNFCWSDSNDPEKLWLLKEAGRACHDTSIALGTPFISGKDSMFNDFSGYTTSGAKVKVSNIPSLLITAVGIIDDYEDIVSLDAKYPEDLIYLIDMKVEVKRALEIFGRYYSALKNQLVASAIPVGLGGRLVSIAKMLIANGHGGTIFLENNKDNLEKSHEIVVTVAPKNELAFRETFLDTEITKIGTVTREAAVEIGKSTKIEVDALLSLYKRILL
ncbi:AIR synthase-related protein [Neorickettsia sennetsu]|uniref:Phosphoribosylformylglycinamidine synthase subunit PurL n=1 Tax=Ehrlichia sennetsu (strain ATCC VR-367 / Miyayama) TaxID=222891 RepID=Q2GCW2_EHRS3|nr:AIR synthase-related protein [Neorickettsia sennetsu]ABD45628.1 putative phosphoribosylformylglycinamidine synthase II [Neorickettsia sennetsu str. Miyayama]